MSGKYDDWTIALINEGKTYAEIADIQHRDMHNVRKTCIRLGINYSVQPVNETEITKRLSEYGYEYIDGFINVDGYARMRCKACGMIVRKSLQVFKSSYKCKVTCPNCKKIRQRQNKEQRERERAKRLEDAKAKRDDKVISRFSCDTMSMSVCPCCGNLFIPVGNMKYCSSACAKRINNAIKKDRRIRKIKHVVVDKNITIQRLYERDNGRCYLCGRVCDWSACEDKDGAFIAYDNYPSIDHVIPLSKGGLHAWDNVKLACRGCNNRKSDKEIAPLV